MAQKRPFATNEQIEALARVYPTPFYLYDEAGIRRTAEALASAFSWAPSFREYFAVKATPNPAIISILAEYGCGVDCSSACELLMAEALGLSGERIIFCSNDTPAGEFAHAGRLGATIILDDETHIDALLAEQSALPERVGLRFNPGGDFDFANGIFGRPEEAKFGLTEDQLLEAATRLRELGVEQIGLHALLASNTLTNEYYPALARRLFQLAVRLQDERGIRIAFVDLSGGVGIDYRLEDEPNDIAAIGAGVRRAYEEVLAPAGLDDVAIFTELGRFMTGPHALLITRVIHTKETYRNYLGVDACASNLMRPMLYGAYHHITVLGREDEPACVRYDVTGMLCENSDKLAVDRLLPRAQVGDLLAIHDVGAHGHSMGYTYNGRLRSAEVLLDADGSHRLIRRAETPLDYFATLDVLPIGSDLAALVRRSEGEPKGKPARP